MKERKESIESIRKNLWGIAKYTFATTLALFSAVYLEIGAGTPPKADQQIPTISNFEEALAMIEDADIPILMGGMDSNLVAQLTSKPQDGVSFIRDYCSLDSDFKLVVFDYTGNAAGNAEF